jgi:hypothetical protein
MRKGILMSVLLASVVVLSGCEQGSYMNISTTQMDSDAVARLTATGNDLRVYEFTPQTSPHMQCVFIAGERKGGLECFPKKSGEMH